MFSSQAWASRCSRSSSSAPASLSTPFRPPRPAAASELGAALFNMPRCEVIACLLAAVERDSYWAHMGWDADDAASHRDSSRLSSLSLSILFRVASFSFLVFRVSSFVFRVHGPVPGRGCILNLCIPAVAARRAKSENGKAKPGKSQKRPKPRKSRNVKTKIKNNARVTSIRQASGHILPRRSCRVVQYAVRSRVARGSVSGTLVD